MFSGLPHAVAGHALAAALVAIEGNLERLRASDAGREWFQMFVHPRRAGGVLLLQLMRRYEARGGDSWGPGRWAAGHHAGGRTGRAGPSGHRPAQPLNASAAPA